MNRKPLWVMAHMDIASPGDLKLWKTDPFKAVVKRINLRARLRRQPTRFGVPGLLTVKAFMDLGIRPPVNYVLLLNADEEIGSTYGIVDILKNTTGKTFPKRIF